MYSPGEAVPRRHRWPLGDAILRLNPSGRGGVHPPEPGCAVLLLRQSSGVRLGALAGEYGRHAMMPHLESVASEDVSTLRQLCRCATRRFSSFLESLGLGIENPEFPRGRLDGG